MTFVSYAQNFEDVMLHRALKHVGTGFYIDVGANDPVIFSVTKAFYDLGWRGLSIEPVSAWCEKLQSERSEDVNLQVAVSDHNGELHFFEVIDTGLSTCDEETARRHAKDHGLDVREYVVPTRTLTDICVEHNVETVHFLKIDVEGAEGAVLRGLDLERIRPWIIIVEATLPLTQEIRYEEWEPLLVGHGYHFEYFDGVNRFYVANEHSELNSHFQTPPNCFDEFVLGNGHWLRRELDVALNDKETQRQRMEAAFHEKETKCQLLEEALIATFEGHQLEVTLVDVLRDKTAQCRQLDAALQEKEARRQQLEVTLQEKEAQRRQLEVALYEKEAQRQQLEAALHDVLHSRSWRITKPLRWLGVYTKKMRVAAPRVGCVPISFGKRIVKTLLGRLARFVLARPHLASWVSKPLSRVPSLKARLRRVAVKPSTAGQHIPHSPKDLSPRALQVWQDLMQARARHVAGSKDQTR